MTSCCVLVCQESQRLSCLMFLVQLSSKLSSIWCHQSDCPWWHQTKTILLQKILPGPIRRNLPSESPPHNYVCMQGTLRGSFWAMLGFKHHRHGFHIAYVLALLVRLSILQLPAIRLQLSHQILPYMLDSRECCNVPVWQAPEQDGYHVKSRSMSSKQVMHPWKHHPLLPASHYSNVVFIEGVKMVWRKVRCAALSLQTKLAWHWQL